MEQNNKLKKNKNFGQIFITIFIVVLLGLLLGKIVVSYAFPKIQESEAIKDLKSISQQTGNIQSYNKDIKDYASEQMSGLNVEQKQLFNSNSSNNETSFIFYNGKTDIKNQKVLKVFIDFSDQKSKDFILINQESLKKMVETGAIKLEIISTPSNNAYSIYASEALAESFYTTPENTWNYFIDLIKLSYNINTDSPKDIISEIAELSEKDSIKDITEDSISNGTFVNWLLGVEKDINLTKSYLLPIIILDGKMVDTESVDINNVMEFQLYVLNN